MSDVENITEEPVGQRKSRAASIWALFGGLSLLIAVGMVVGAVCFYFMVDRVTTGPVDKLADAISTVFGTEVEVRGETVVLEKAEIGELALVQRKTQAIVKYQTSWLGSEKLLIVRGDFLVKAGFDLSEGGNWGILDGKIDGKLPVGKVLSVEQIGDLEIYHSDDGAINKLKPQDHATAFNYLMAQARRDAEHSDIGREAEQVLLRRINDRMSGLDGGLEWSEEALP